MADIFISYAREDETRIRELVRALEEQGWTIFWDRRIPAGKTWQSYIGQALSEAKCVVVAWSHHSVTSDWVIEEANDAKDRGVLVPVFLDSVKPPLGFRGIQAADLTDWKPGASSPQFDQLIQDIAGVTGGKPYLAVPEELVTPRTEPVATPRTIPTELLPHEPTLPKPELPRQWKKRKIFLTGGMIALVAAIVAVVALWSSQEPRLPETRPVEPPVAKAPEVRPQTQEVPKPAVKPPEPQVSEPKPASGAPTQRTFTNNIDMSFVLIPKGGFTIGSPTGEPGRSDNERQHPVTISKPFYLQTTEVTQEQWERVMGGNPSSFKDCGDDCPVETVSWGAAQEFIEKLNKTESGAKYRLPTEAEWEYACRAGSKGGFCFGDEETKLGEYAWYKGNSGGKTHPVRKKKPNTWGLYDIHGNVWEWCQDWYGYYPTRHLVDPTGPESGESNVLRGGSWYNDAGHVRSAVRVGRWRGFRDHGLGFRVARDP
jgi:formylglycine-generating enzyme required for sulfatase activity